MTRQQFDNVSYKLSTLIDKQACACIKATFDSENFNRFLRQIMVLITIIHTWAATQYMCTCLC